MLGFTAYVVISIGLGVATWSRPAAAVAAIYCVQVLDFWGQMSSPIIYEYGKVTNIYIALLGMLGAVRGRLTRSAQLEGVPYIKVLLLIFWLYAFLSLSWSRAMDTGLAEWLQWSPYMFLVLMAPEIIRERGDLYRALIVLLMTGGTLIGLVDIFATWQDRYVLSFWNADTRFWNALAFASLGGYVAIAAILLKSSKNWIWISVRVLAVIAGLVVAVKSGTRGQFALMVVVPLVLLPFCLRMRNISNYFLFMFAAALLIGGALWAFSHFGTQADVDGRWSQNQMDSDMLERWRMAQRLLDYWWRASQSNPLWLFVGLGNSSSFSPHIVGYYPHVLTAEVLAEEGILGLATLLTLLILVTVNLVRAVKTSEIGSEERHGAIAVFGMFAYSFILSFKQGSLAGSAEMFLPVVLLEQHVRVLSTKLLSTRDEQIGAGDAERQQASAIRFDNVMR